MEESVHLVFVVSKIIHSEAASVYILPAPVPGSESIKTVAGPMGRCALQLRFVLSLIIVVTE
jgi:hypothetical protein